MNLGLPPGIWDIRCEVIPPDDPRHPSNPDSPRHALWLRQQALKREKREKREDGDKDQ